MHEKATIILLQIRYWKLTWLHMVIYVSVATMKHKILDCRVYEEINYNQDSLQLIQLVNQLCTLMVSRTKYGLYILHQ